MERTAIHNGAEVPMPAAGSASAERVDGVSDGDAAAAPVPVFKITLDGRITDEHLQAGTTLKSHFEKPLLCFLFACVFVFYCERSARPT